MAIVMLLAYLLLFVATVVAITIFAVNTQVAIGLACYFPIAFLGAVTVSYLSRPRIKQKFL